MPLVQAAFFYAWTAGTCSWKVIGKVVPRGSDDAGRRTMDSRIDRLAELSALEQESSEADSRQRDRDSRCKPRRFHRSRRA
jgi:hypothetical protein